MRMAASSVQRPEKPCKMLAFTVLLITSLLNAGVMASEETRGDMIPKTTVPHDLINSHGQIILFPTDDLNVIEPTTATTAEEQETVGVSSSPNVSLTQEPMPSRGDGPHNIPKEKPQDVVCVTKEAVQNKNAVSLKLKVSSSCKDTKAKIQSVLQELCDEDCKLEIYQEDNTAETLVSGKYVEDDVTGMTNKFNNDNIKDKTDVEEAFPRWGKNSKLVLVSLLLTGLLLAALLVAGYYLKTHRKNSKGVRLAESFQVDEENQANTLVSVAPLPQEPVDKPTVNGESPPENGTNPAPTTNGHSQTQTPVADTEM